MASVENLASYRTRRNEPIAVIGSGCKFPGGATSPTALWELLRKPRDVLSEIPPNRFNVNGFYHPDPSFPGRSNVKHSYFLEQDVAQFDAQFFNVTPAEAAAMDPQQRILLETVFEGLEAAGLTIEELRGSDTGVYVGQMYGDYESLQYRDLQHLPTYHATAGPLRATGATLTVNSPSLTVDTACSSSLVALHQAVQALRNGDVHVAVAAGTNLLLGPEPYISESKLKMLSPDGRSRMWDHEANGYARGDGVAAIILKKLSSSLADGDNIECIIRETGVNQDGRSMGITMPKSSAQAALIRETYKKAGLDPKSRIDRCQYFEAHGTGTPAGDPVEAEAIHTAFFGDAQEVKGDLRQKDRTEEEMQKAKQNKKQNGIHPLYVGSIKTVIGHTESTAGIAGILKVVQAMKHGLIPPNLLLNRLNPAVLPFYEHLEIPQELTPWPQIPGKGGCRRASVNSFGFGGTNAHVILESFEPRKYVEPKSPNFTSTFTSTSTPFLFSAQSEQSLLANLTVFQGYLEHHVNTNPSDLAWTLRERRSRLPLRLSFPASSIEVLQANLSELIRNFQLGPKHSPNDLGKNCETRLLGVFTGQGAQWPRMGAELVETSQYASNLLSDLDDTLSQLPVQDRPLSTLRQELLADLPSSNVHTASVSQPLCTALQIILVELLRQAGVRFAVVVGHSSGEIAAAFAAGHLSAREAICIAYYRGFHSHLASGLGDLKGSMLAVGTSLEDAEELCNEEHFKGRINVAACNSPSSVTLSGDDDAISEVSKVLEDENKFVRRLNVEKAYHSHHMLPCSQPYLKSMEGFPIETLGSSDPTSVWVSSVHPDRIMEETSNLEHSYWIDNLLSPVIFTGAIERAMVTGPFDGVVEVGPHSALKNPIRETLQHLRVDIPYTSLLQRDKGARETFSNALGYLWTQLVNLDIDFNQYEAVMNGPRSYNFISDLPVYQWKHTQRYWHESTLSRNFRHRSHPVHPLLGDLAPQSSSQQLTWTNIMRPKELTWLHNHRIQGQTIFPGAGYAVTALETVPFIAGERPVQIVELEDLIVHRPMVFEDGDQESGIDVRSIVGSIKPSDSGSITGNFTYEACSRTQKDFHLVATAKLNITIGDSSPQLLPATRSREPYMIDVPSENFYSAMEELGYEYTGPFKALSNLKRRLGKSVGYISLETNRANGEPLVIHPAVLDAAFQSIILAFTFPGDRRLRALHLPVRVQKIRVNPSLCGHHWLTSDKVSISAAIHDVHNPIITEGFRGDVELYNNVSGHPAIQVEGFHAVPLSPAMQADDQQMFYSMHWIDSEPHINIPGTQMATAEEMELSIVLERGSFYYLCQLNGQIPMNHSGRSDKFFAAYLNFASHTVKQSLEGKHRYIKKEWFSDTLEDIKNCSAPFATRPEIRLMHVVGEKMPQAIRGETHMLEHLLMDGLLDEYYAKSVGVAVWLDILSENVLQIARRYPRMKILEVGAGTGGATRKILNHVGEFSTYTFTDISPAFFNKAQAEFESYEDRMTYRVLDLEQDIHTQGFEKQSYDLIIASLVIHATKSIEQTTRKVRSLLKPGGYLILYEVTNVEAANPTSSFGCLPGWWAGMEEGRTLGAPVSASAWDTILRKTGFSGIDTMTPVHDALSFPNSVIVSQAVDDLVEFIRQPLSAHLWSLQGQSLLNQLFIVGGSTLRVAGLIDDFQSFIQGFCDNVTRVERLEDLNHDYIDSTSTVLVLEDLDNLVFKDITAARFDGVKKLFGQEITIVWVTENRMVDNPFSNMPIGFSRSALWEVEFRCQFIDFQELKQIDVKALVEAVLRFRLSGSVQYRQHNLLWSVESEIIITKDNRQLIPRLEPVRDANNRYNSARRTITKKIHPKTGPVAISRRNDRYVLYEHITSSNNHMKLDSDTPISLKVNHSTLQSVETIFGHAFVVLGKCSTNDTQHLGLAHFTSSVVEISKNRVIPVSVLPQHEVLFLKLVAVNLLLPKITAKLGRGDIIAVQNPPLIVVKVVDRVAESTGIRIINLTTSQIEAQQNNWIYTGKYLPQSQLASLLPSKVSRFVDFTGPFTHSVQPSRILAFLPRNIHVINFSELFHNGQDPGFSPGDDFAVISMLEEARNSAMVDLGIWKDDLTLSSHCNIQTLLDNVTISDPLAIIRWDLVDLPLSLEPAKTQFKQNVTYWLVGLSGDLGISIAEWMIRNGARNLVISSRNPEIDSVWLKNVENEGATVQIISSDVTNYDDLKRAHRKICSSLPPIAGVAQGAMVLKDVAFRNMKIGELTQVTRPKVDGSGNLDSLFYDEPLDFFLLFASSASVLGNPGQANYTAGNLFMDGLAQSRRRRGFSASVIDLGIVIGIGYVTRETGDALSQAMIERGHCAMSESDVHRSLTEAVNNGHPDSGLEWHISAGLTRIPMNSPHRPAWLDYPQFACLSTSENENNANTSTQKVGVSIQDQLAKATTVLELEKIITGKPPTLPHQQALLKAVTDFFVHDLRKTLHLGNDYELDISSRTDELGSDSLVAVRIRSWFMNNLQVNIPALKIMRGISLRELIGQAVNEVPNELTPRVQRINSEVKVLFGVEKVTERKDQIDWATETAPLQFLETSHVPDTLMLPSTPPQVIILTGSTGFLGQHLLRALTDQPSVRKVICVATRILREEIKILFAQSDKVEWYMGDLRLPRLGLSEKEASNIFKTADSVIHNGADVSHLKTYSSLRSANVGSTQELVTLCLSKKIPLHFISTASVMMNTKSENFPEISAREFQPPPTAHGGMHGYLSSKWVSEVYLENTSTRFGLPVYIHRPSNIIRPESDMMSDTPTADTIQNLMAYSRKIHAVPVPFGLRGFVYLVQPDTVVSKIVDVVMGHKPGYVEEVTYIHETGDIELDITQLKQYLSKETGKEFEEISLDSWISRAKEVGLSDAMAAVFQSVGTSEKIKFPRLIKK